MIMVSMVHILEAFNQESMALNHVNHLLFTVTSSTKWIIYFIFHDQFKKESGRICGCCQIVRSKFCNYNGNQKRETTYLYRHAHDVHLGSSTPLAIPEILLQDMRNA